MHKSYIKIQNEIKSTKAKGAALKTLATKAGGYEVGTILKSGVIIPYSRKDANGNWLKLGF